MDEEMENDLAADVESFTATQVPFKIELKDFDAFRPKVIFLHVKPSDKLAALRSALEADLLSLQKYPIKPEERPFHPHVTIANRDLMRKDFPEAFKHFTKIAYTQTFLATEVSLLRHEAGGLKVVQNFELKT